MDNSFLNYFFKSLFMGNLYIDIILLVVLGVCLGGLYLYLSKCNKIFCLIIHVLLFLLFALLIRKNYFELIGMSLVVPWLCVNFWWGFSAMFEWLTDSLPRKTVYSFIVMFIFCIAFVLFMRASFLRDSNLNASIAYSEAYKDGMADVEKEKESIYDSGYDAGYEKGYDAGQFDVKMEDSDFFDAYTSGFESGYDVGYEDGHDVGYDKGYYDAED